MNLAQLTRSLFAPKAAIRKPLERRCRPQLEGLTDRIAPAVTASVVGGVLIIKATGAAADDSLTLAPDIQFTDQLFLHTTNAGTLNGFVNGTFNAIGVTSIRCDLGDGDDGLIARNLVLTGGVSFRGGSGSNALNLNNVNIGGSVTVTNRTNTTGSDNTTITFSIVKGSVNVNNGLGSTGAYFSNLNILGSLKYTTASNALTPGDDSISASVLDVDGNITLALANGTNGFLGIINSAPIKSDGSFKYTGGSGKDTLDFQAGAIIGTSATITLGENDNKLMVDRNNGLSVGTKLTVTSGAGIDSVDLTSTALSRVTGAAAFNLGNGTNTFTTDSLQVGSLGLTTGKGNDTGTFDNLTVDGAATLKFGAGTNTVKLASTAASSDASAIGGTLTLTTGAGADQILVGSNNAVDVTGAAKFTTGTTALDNGNDFLQISRAVFASSVTIVNGAGHDELHIGDLASVDIVGKLTVNAKAGNDQLYLGTFNDPAKFVHLMVVPVLIGGAGGGDIVRMFAGGNVQGLPNAVVNALAATLAAAGWEGLV